jgi:hypothetical protein
VTAYAENYQERDKGDKKDKVLRAGKYGKAKTKATE